ncbi:MAG: MFS transporter [Candidatus Dormibacteria bacterium]
MGALGVLALLLLAYNLRVAVSSVPPILGDLGLSRGAQSLLVTVPVVCFGLAALAGPSLRRRLGEEQLLLLVVGVLTLGLVVRAVWPGAGLFVGTVLTGLGVAVMNVVLPALIRGRFPGRAAAMTSAYTVSLSVGAGMAAGLTVPVLHASGSIRLALGIWALPAALAGVVWLTQLGHSGSRSTADVERGPAPVTARLWSSPVLWAVTGFFGLQSLIYYAMLSWLPSVYRARGDSAQAAGLLLAVLAVIGIGGNLLGPALASRGRDQRLGIWACVPLTVVGLLGVLFGPLGLAPLFVAIFGIGSGASFSLALLFMVLRSANAATAVQLSAMAQGTGYLIAAAGPLVLGLIQAVTRSWTIPLLLVLAVVVLELWPGLAAARDRTLELASPAQNSAS